MKVAIVTSNESVMINVVSMAAKNGCKFTKVKRYSLDMIKGHDYCIFDLDNLKESWDTIKQDIQNMSEMVVLGITRSDDIADMFRPIISVEKKPFLVNTFIEYKKQVRGKVESDYVINKDADRIYDALGVKVTDLLDEQVLTDADRLQLLADKIENSKTPIEKEDEFLKKIGVDEIAVPEPVIMAPNMVEKVNIFEDNALLMYRTRKLRTLNLSVAEIEERLRLLSERSHVKAQTKTSAISSDIASKLKSGYFSRKKNVPVATAEIQHVQESKPPELKQPEVKPEPIPSVEEVKKNVKPTEEIKEAKPVLQEEKVIKEPERKPIKPVKQEEVKPVETKKAEVKSEPKEISEEVVKDETDEISEFEKRYIDENQEEERVIVEKPKPMKEEVELRETPEVKSRPESESKPEPKKEVDRKPIVPEKKDAGMLDVKLSPEMEERLNAQLSRLKNMRRPASPKPGTTSDERHPGVKSGPVVPDSEHDDYGLDKAVSRLGGRKSKPENKKVSPTVQDSSEERLVKEMPTTSLFDLIKGQVSSHPKDDSEEKKKASIEKIIKPPER